MRPGGLRQCPETDRQTGKGIIMAKPTPEPKHPGDEAEAAAPPGKKRIWTKPVVRPLYQIENVSTHPIISPLKTGEFGTTYRGS